MSAPDRVARLLERENGRRPDVVRLARALSVAARVEPALLRRVRTRLFPEMDPGAESDLWFSPLVESAGHGGFVLDARVAEVLRETVAREHGAHLAAGGAPGDSLLVRVERILEETHAGRLPSIWAEERATILALRGEPPEAIEEALRPAARAMVESEERGLEVARWAVRALPRLPEAARRTEAAAMLALGASARLGGRPISALPDGEGGLSPHLAWTLPPEILSERTELSVRLLRGGIEFLAPDADPDLPVVSLPRTHPLLVALSWGTGSEAGRKLAHVQPGKVVLLPPTVAAVTLRTLAGDEYDLQAAGEGGAEELVLDERFAWAADALVRVQPEEPWEGRITGWFVTPNRIVTLASRFAGEPPYLHVHWRDHHFPARVVEVDREADLLLLEPIDAPPEIRLNLPPAAEGLHSASSRDLTALGFTGEHPVSVEVRLGETTSQGGVADLVSPEVLHRVIANGLAGGPVLLDDRVVGYVVPTEPPGLEELKEDQVRRLLLRDVRPLHQLLAAADVPVEAYQQNAEPSEVRQAVEDSPTTSADEHSTPPTVYISYSHKDMVWKDRLVAFLRPLEQQGVSIWYDHNFEAGEEWRQTIEEAVDAAKIAVLLVSPDWLSSDFVQKQELIRLLQRREQEGLRILPVLVRPCDLGSAGWLRQMQLLPRDARPLSLFSPSEMNRELAAVADEVGAIVSELARQAAPGVDTEFAQAWDDSIPQESIANPFIWRSGVIDPEDFFDRDKEKAMLRDFLARRQSCQIVGPRRIGKTSLLRQAQHMASVWEDDIVAAYLDLQGTRGYLASDWRANREDQLGLPTAHQTLAEFSATVKEMVAARRRPVLFLDEFEGLTSRPEEFTRDFFLALRSWGQQGMSIVTASRKPLHEVVEREDPMWPFFNDFVPLYLGSFSDSDAREFVTRQHPGISPFTEEETEAILRFAGGHPFALQVACFHMVEARRRGDGIQAALGAAADDVRSTLPDFIPGGLSMA